MEELRRISKFSLKNSGGFVCSGSVIAEWEIEENGKKIAKRKEFKSGHSMALGTTRTLDLKEMRIVDGAKVTLKVDITGGKDNTSSEHFLYDSNVNNKAYFTISGTTLNSHLKLTEIS